MNDHNSLPCVASRAIVTMRTIGFIRIIADKVDPRGPRSPKLLYGGSLVLAGAGSGLPWMEFVIAGVGSGIVMAQGCMCVEHNYLIESKRLFRLRNHVIGLVESSVSIPRICGKKSSTRQQSIDKSAATVAQWGRAYLVFRHDQTAAVLVLFALPGHLAV